MLRSLLIGLDGSDDGRSVLDLGLLWAKRFDALAVGVGIVDEPGILGSGAVLLEGSHHWHAGDAAAPLLSNSRHRVEQALEQFTRRCVEAGVTSRTRAETGTPHVRILEEARNVDLVLLGREAHFSYGYEGVPDETPGKVLRDSPRPVVAVPRTIGKGEAVVIAYDGSLQASRALYAFEASGLGRHQKVHVVSVASNHQDAARLTDRPVEFLRYHGIEATPHAIDTSVPTAQAILNKVRHLEAGLVVMGAYGQPILREFFLGSVTRSVLEESSVPVFCYH
jgi:nucleotide-binding universal stress UspA family protein